MPKGLSVIKENYPQYVLRIEMSEREAIALTTFFGALSFHDIEGFMRKNGYTDKDEHMIETMSRLAQDVFNIMDDNL